MINIAIDGLSGSGKGELAKGLSKNFNLKHLDTGAIFRTMGIIFWKKKISDPTEGQVESILNDAKIEINFDTSSQRMFLNGEDVTPFLREEEVSKLASKVSAFSYAREKYLSVVGEFANHYDCVIDGRDITSIVLPDADVKIYLTADEKTRAERRYKENLERKIEDLYKNIMMEDELQRYRIEVHGLKSSAAAVGALLLSKLARLQELAVIDKDYETINALHPILMNQIRKTIMITILWKYFQFAIYL